MIDTTGKTIEEVVEEMFKALCEQGEPCMDNNVCSYGNDDGQHCAVGFLLDDKVDDGIMQSRDSIRDLSRHYSLGANHDFIMANESILLECQCIHDADNEISITSYKEHLAIKLGGITPQYVDQWVAMRCALWSEDQC